MGILDFFRNKKQLKNNAQTNPAEDVQTIVVKEEESEEDRIRRELMSRTYDANYLFYASHWKTVEINGKPITYSHLECYLSSDEWPCATTQLVRLTGDNLTGQPIPIKYRRFIPGEFGFPDETITWFVDFEQKCMLFPNSIGNTCYPKNKNLQYLTGYQIAEKVKEQNDCDLNRELERQSRNEESLSL